MALNMAIRSFTAPSLRSFWRYWNAGTNYFLLFYCYRPLRQFLSHGVALLLTFALCGLDHDLVLLVPASLMAGNDLPFPFITTWFTIIGGCILLTDRLHISFARLSASRCVALHSAFLLATFSATVWVDRLW